MPDDVPTTELLQRLRAGDPRAADDLFNRFAQQLVRLAEQYISQHLARRIEGEDVVQSAFVSFFRRHAEGRFQIDNATQLWHLLVKITVLKARAKRRFHQAGLRDINAELHAADPWFLEALADEPGPEEALVLVDQIENLLQGLPEFFGDVLHARLQGYSVAEIAEQMHVSRQTIYRTLNLLQQRLTASAG